MSQIRCGRLLAIVLDAAEPTLVRKLIDQGDMPALQQLLEDGKWMRVESPASIGSGAVWPTFMSGEQASVHGVYGEWLWHPETMTLSRYSGGKLIPFWQGLAEKGVTVGILDVPFMPVIGLSSGFEVSEWGPHDVFDGRTQIGPAQVVKLVARETATHPMPAATSVSGPQDYRNLRKLGDACVTGIKLRGALARNLLTETTPQLSLIAFTEIHRSAHYLWHKVEPEHKVYHNGGFATLASTQPTMEDIFREVDRQVGELIKAVGEETPVMVFSLHGMQPGHGVPALLAPLLIEMGVARLTGWNSQGWPDRARSVFATIKRNLPAGFRRFYYKIVSSATKHRVAGTTMLPLYDWSRTEAFSLPTDQHGWIRINLKGREARGIVPAERYDDICRELENRLRNLSSEDGRPLVSEVIRTAAQVEDAMIHNLPDLVVHWEDAAFEWPLRIKGSAIKSEAEGKKYVGQHSLEGFCILKAPLGFNHEGVLTAQNMHRLMIGLLEDPAPVAKMISSQEFLHESK